MGIIRQVQFLVGLTALGVAGLALADAPNPAATPDTVVIVGARNCIDASPERARSLADKATRDGDYQRAGECYLAAGEQSLADQAFVKAISQTSAGAMRNLATNLQLAKAQARQVKEAFHRR